MSPEVDFAIETQAGPDGTTIVTLAGELDLYRLPAITEALATTSGRVLVDLSEVTFMDSGTMDHLLEEHRRLQQTGGELIVLTSEETPTTVFSVTGIDQILTMRPSGTPATGQSTS